MRIFGGHDYYDCGLSLGIDPTITLVRAKNETIPAKDAGGTLLEQTLDLQSGSSFSGLSLPCVAVAFCDKVYRGAMANGRGGESEGIWSAEKLRAWVALSKHSSVEVLNHHRRSQPKVTLEEYFTPYKTSGALREFMIARKISILVEWQDRDYYRDEPRMRVNPFTLKQIDFARAVDPYTAFQELSMWIGGVLGGVSPETVKITDDLVLAENHGFDKHSFRSSSRA